MSSLFRRIFNLFPGEEKSAAAFALLGFLWAIAVTSGLKFADALFLLHVGSESLPIAYSLSAVCMILISSLLIYAFNNYTLEKIFIAALSVGVLFYLFAFSCFYFRIGLSSRWIWYLLRVFGSINFAVIVTCFWTFVDQYFHLQDAKRLFSLFSSTVFLGVATTGLVMLLGLIEFQTLCLIISGTLILTICLILHIHKTFNPVHDDINAELDQVSFDVSIRDFITKVLSSRFTLLLMASNILIFLLLVTTEFNYYSTFDRHFAPEQISAGDEADAALTLFLGKALMTVSVTNLIFGLFFYSRLLRRFGIGFLIPVTPLILIITYSGWLIEDSLFFALLGYFVVEGTLYVIDDSNFNLLLNAVPAKLKYKIRVSIESFFEPIGTLFAAFLLSVSWINPKILGLGLAILLILVAIFIKRSYARAIYENLSDNAIHFGRTTRDWIESLGKKGKKGAISRLLAIFRHGEGDAKSFALEGLIGINDRGILKKLLHEIDHLPIEEKMEFIKKISNSDFSTDRQVIEKVQDWLRDENDPKFYGGIYWFLAKQGLIHPDKLQNELESPDLILKAAAILALKNSSADLSFEESLNNKSAAYEQIKRLLDSDDEESVRTALKILSADPSHNDLEIVIPYLSHESLIVNRQAARTIMSMANKKSAKTASKLTQYLTKTSDYEVRRYLLKALMKIGDTAELGNIVAASNHFRAAERREVENLIAAMGLKNVPLLISLIKDVNLPDRSRLTAAKALGRISVFQLRAKLESILKPEIVRALFYFTHWHTVQEQNPEIDLRLLQDTLRNGYYSALDFIIQLLGVAEEIEDSELLSRSMRSHNLKLRSQVIETLEKTCEPKIFRLLLPLLEEAPKELKIHYYLKLGGRLLSLSALLYKMEQSSSLADEIVAYSFMQKLNMKNWKELLKKHMTTGEEIFKHFAYELLET